MSNKPEKIDKISAADIDGLEKLIEKKINKLPQDGAEKKAKAKATKQVNNETRASIARWFVIGHLLSLPFTIIIVMLYNAVLLDFNKTDSLLELEKIIPIVTSFIGSPVGFVLGYYFKSEENKK